MINVVLVRLQLSLDPWTVGSLVCWILSGSSGSTWRGISGDFLCLAGPGRLSESLPSAQCACLPLSRCISLSCRKTLVCWGSLPLWSASLGGSAGTLGAGLGAAGLSFCASRSATSSPPCSGTSSTCTSLCSSCTSQASQKNLFPAWVVPRSVNSLSWRVGRFSWLLFLLATAQHWASSRWGFAGSRRRRWTKRARRRSVYLHHSCSQFCPHCCSTKATLFHEGCSRNSICQPFGHRMISSEWLLEACTTSWSKWGTVAAVWTSCWPNFCLLRRLSGRNRSRKFWLCSLDWEECLMA